MFKETNEMIQNIMFMTVLISGLFFTIVSSATAQTDCKTAEKLAQENAPGDELNVQRDCWLRKLKTATRNFSGAYLSRADLRGIDLSGTNFTRADLNGANLSGTNLIVSNLNLANLSEVNFFKADLGETSFVEADLRGANLTDANLRGANFKNAKLNEGIFIGIVRVKNMVCTMSDDEGPSNDADMGFFRITVNDQELYKYEGDPITTPVGYDWKVDKVMPIVFTNRSYPQIKIRVEAVEVDNYPVNEKADRTIFLNQGFRTGGFSRDSFTISSSDFEFQVNVEMEIVAQGKQAGS